ncbi:hypothetical protein JYQ62_16565 [Nostoc sp. UHCC 0702]|nr:hypothetical protein JYQ62_16565 [Nostoc sp. UHCC 0702]
MDFQNLDVNVKWHLICRKKYTIYQSGSHIKGNFLQVYVPKNPCRHQGKVKLITYLHGFALCMPKFYECHLDFLANQGYYIFFPDFQNSTYPDYLLESENIFNTNKTKLLSSSFWFKILTEAISKRDDFQIEDYIDEHPNRSNKVGFATPELVKPTYYQYIRLALASLILLFIFWFQPRYEKHLMKLLSTVLLSLIHSPIEWLRHAIDMTDKAWEDLCKDNLELSNLDFDFYVFGHSVGGLLALSWPYYIGQSKRRFLPKQIITADPAPSSEKGIPDIAIFILKLLCLPFVRKPINIRNTGHKISVPVGIMHGADDKIIKPQFWIKRSFWHTKSNFDCIASRDKKIYFSLSNKQTDTPLIAFHNQAVTDTTYFDDDLFKIFGGVKKFPNAYNYEYIWPGLNLVVQEQVRVDKLLDKFPLKTIEVKDSLPPKSIFWKIVIPTVIVFFGLVFYTWFFSTVFSI